MEELARYRASAFRKREPRGPYTLSGFCDDGVFAYEVASQLTAQGLSVGQFARFYAVTPSPDLRVRIATGLKRMIIRVRFRVNEILRIKIVEILRYMRNRSKELNRLIMRI
jgi:thioesterase domain-containing protein